MPAPSYTQYRFFGFNLPDGKGYIEVVINDNNTTYTQSAGDTIYLDGTRWFSNVAKLVKRVESEQHRVVCDIADIDFLDAYKFSGEVDGVNIGVQDLTSEKKSFFEHVFANAEDGSLYTIWLVRHRGDATSEIIFSGDIRPNDIKFYPRYIENDHTSNEKRLTGRVKLKLSPIQRRLEDATIEDFIDEVDPDTDIYQTGTGFKSIYGGAQIIKARAGAGPDVAAQDLITGYLNGENPDFTGWLETGQINDASNVGHLSYFAYSENSVYAPFPGGTHLVSLPRILDVLGRVIDVDFAINSGGSLNQIPIRFFLRRFNNTTHLYEDHPDLGADPPGYAFELALHYQGIFGIDPATGEKIDDGSGGNLSPITYAKSAPLSQVLKDVCIATGTVCVFEIIQSGADIGRTVVRLRNRLVTVGVKPTNWTLSGQHSEDAPEKQAVAVKVKYRGDDTYAYCPKFSEDAMEIEIPWRTHAQARLRGGDDGKVFGQHLTYDFGRGILDQDKTWIVWAPPAGSGGWLGSAHLLYPYAGSTNFAFPSQFDDKSLDPVDPENWDGGYVIDSLQWGSDTDTRYENGLTLYSILYANVFARRGILVRRSYIGLTDDSDSIHDIQPLLKGQWYYRGGTGNSQKTWIGNEITFDLQVGTVGVLWQQTTSSTEGVLTQLPVTVRGRGSSGAGGGVGPASSGGETEDHVALYPDIEDRNKMEASNDVETLAIKRSADQTSGTHTFAIYDASDVYKGGWDDSLVLRSDVGIKLSGASSPVLLNSSAGTSGQVLTSAGSGNTPTWQNAADLTTAVIKSPASAQRNEVQPTADAVVALELKKRGSSTANLFTVKDDSSNPHFEIDDDFNVLIDGASLSINTAGNVNVNNGYAALHNTSLGSDDLRLSSTAANGDNPDENYWQGTCATTDGTTWVTLGTYQTVTNTAFSFFVKILGVRTGGGSGAAQDGYRRGIYVSGRNVGGTPTVQNTTQMYHHSSTGDNVRFNVNGTTVQIQVQGSASTNISWECHVRDLERNA